MPDMTLAEALALADQDSPMPHLAGQALKVLRARIASDYLALQQSRWIVAAIHTTSVSHGTKKLRQSNGFKLVEEHLAYLNAMAPLTTKDC